MNRYRFDNSLDGKGKEKHLHTLDGKPLCGTSTVLQVLAKPLTWWASGEAVKTLGWTHPMIDGTRKKKPAEERLEAVMPFHQRLIHCTPTEYLSMLDDAYKAHSIKLDTSATAGTDMHAQLEEYVKWCIAFNDGMPSVRPDMSNFGDFEHNVRLFCEWSCDNVDIFTGSELHCYSERLWTGGIIDLAYRDKEGNAVLLDFKSAKEAYPTHFLQNAGYDIALDENGCFDADGNGNNIKSAGFADYYGVFPFGMKNAVPQFRADTVELREAFEHCVAIYKFLNNHGT